MLLLFTDTEPSVLRSCSALQFGRLSKLVPLHCPHLVLSASLSQGGASSVSLTIVGYVAASCTRLAPTKPARPLTSMPVRLHFQLHGPPLSHMHVTCRSSSWTRRHASRPTARTTRRGGIRAAASFPPARPTCRGRASSTRTSSRSRAVNSLAGSRSSARACPLRDQQRHHAKCVWIDVAEGGEAHGHRGRHRNRCGWSIRWKERWWRVRRWWRSW